MGSVSVTLQPSIGFLGLGVMGEPMALNLARAGNRVLAWNRSGRAFDRLISAGGMVLPTAREVMAGAEIAILMLANERAIDEVLDRGTSQFEVNVSGRTIVHMGTTSEAYSQGLEADVRSCGGFYVEAPVSGSRAPAEAGRLVAMLAGEERAVNRVRPVLAPLCRETVFCGAVPSALTMKLAVNLFLISMVVGLAEAFHFAGKKGLDLAAFADVLDKTPMASEVSRAKAAKFAAGDFSPHAKASDVLMNNRLILDSARIGDVSTPLLDICGALYGETANSGFGNEDMIAVMKAIQARRRPEAVDRTVSTHEADEAKALEK
jgi:3-hydroxyisobutyrate dehydrogenase